MGFFSTSYALGGLVATPVCGWFAYSVFDSWRAAFFAGGAIILALLTVFVLFQKNSPGEVGLPDIDVIDEDMPRAPREADVPITRGRMRFADLLVAARHDPMVARLGLVYFLLKPARYAILLWGPVLVLQAMPGISKLTAIMVPIAFGVTGMVAPIVFGWVSDTVFDARRVPACVIGLAMLVGVLTLWGPATRTGSVFLVCTMLAALGFAAYGADSMVSGVAAVDFGTSRYAAGAAGFINGCGSIGAILGGFLPGYVGGTALFYGFAVAAALAAVILIPQWNRRPVSA